MKALFVDGPEISDWGIADVKTLTLPVGEIAPLFGPEGAASPAFTLPPITLWTCVGVTRLQTLRDLWSGDLGD